MEYKITNSINSELLYISVNIVFSDGVISAHIPLYSLKNYGIAAIEFVADSLMKTSMLSKHKFTYEELYNLLLDNFLKLFAERYI